VASCSTAAGGFLAKDERLQVMRVPIGAAGPGPATEKSLMRLCKYHTSHSWHISANVVSARVGISMNCKDGDGGLVSSVYSTERCLAVLACWRAASAPHSVAHLVGNERSLLV
jgi:hypothetical protein